MSGSHKRIERIEHDLRVALIGPRSEYESDKAALRGDGRGVSPSIGDQQGRYDAGSS